jgi:hypothetical protein
VYVAVPGGNKLRAIRVVTSITDGTFTAVKSTELKEGDPVAIGLQTAKVGGASGGGRPPGPRM